MSTLSFCCVLAVLACLSRLGITSDASDKGCVSPLGLESGKILDKQLSASRYYHFFFIKSKTAHMKPEYARLNGELAWCCAAGSPEPCQLTVDLGSITNVSGVATQGIEGLISGYFVKSYRIEYGNDGVYWKHFNGSGSDKNREKVWLGNKDGSNIVQNTFPNILQARFVRIYPLSYNHYTCLRMELYGCSSEPSIHKPTVSTAPTPSTAGRIDTSTSVTATTSRLAASQSLPTTDQLPSTDIAPTTNTNFMKNCMNPLGLENGKILGKQLSASQYYHFFSIKNKMAHMKPEYARLNGELAWCCSAGSPEPCYLTVDLSSVTNVSGVATQGIEGLISGYFVKSYRIEYGNDGVHWNHFSDSGSDKNQEKVWQGNKDGSSVVQNTFPNVLQARFLRIYPLSYNHYSCLRMELYGCSSEINVTQPITEPNKLESNSTAKMGGYDKTKGEASPPSGNAVVITTTVLSVVLLALITAVVVLYVWRHRHMKRHAMRHNYSTQIYLTEVAVEPGCEEMGSHTSEHLLITNESSALELPLYSKDVTQMGHLQ